MFEFTKEQEMIRAMVREFAERLSAEVTRWADVENRVRTVEAQVGRILRSVRRAYQGLSTEARHLVSDMFGEFEARCQGALTALAVD